MAVIPPNPTRTLTLSPNAMWSGLFTKYNGFFRRPGATFLQNFVNIGLVFA